MAPQNNNYQRFSVCLYSVNFSVCFYSVNIRRNNLSRIIDIVANYLIFFIYLIYLIFDLFDFFKVIIKSFKVESSVGRANPLIKHCDRSLSSFKQKNNRCFTI